MPELPEVQTIVNDLNRKVVGQKITGVWFDWPKIISIIFADKRGLVRGTARKLEEFREEFERFIKGSKIVSVRRRAKNILIYLKNPRKSASSPRESADKLLLIHQKMTGHMLVGKWEIKKLGKKEIIMPIEPKAVVDDPYNKYIHLILYLNNGKMLALSDLRKFAKVILGSRGQIESLPELVNLGPDALGTSLKFIKFVKLIKSEKRKIKQVLMDQEVIAGIGNIYSDDILWMARIHPLRRANSLRVDELRSLYEATRTILKKALKLRGTSSSDYRDTSGEKGKYGNALLVYQREDEPCQRCKAKIKRIKLGGRSAHYCPKCQIL